MLIVTINDSLLIIGLNIEPMLDLMVVKFDPEKKIGLCNHQFSLYVV